VVDWVEEAEQSFVPVVILFILREIFVNIFAVFDSHKNNFIVFFFKTEAIIFQSYPVKVLKSLDWSYINSLISFKFLTEGKTSKQILLILDLISFGSF
jgi:hypothetical protein